MSYWKTSKFTKLQKEWYTKLDMTGFKDIERFPEFIHEETANFKDREAVEYYYSVARSFLELGEFDTATDSALWYLYSIGKSYREISKAMKLSRSKVTEIIEKYAARMWEKNRK